MEVFSRIISIVDKREPADFVLHDPYGRGDRYDFVIFHTAMMFSYDGTKYFPLQKNTCVVFEPFVPQFYYANNEPMKNSFLILSVDKNYFKKFQFKFNTPIALTDSQTEKIIYLMDRASFIINTDLEPWAMKDVPIIIDNVFHILDETTASTDSPSRQSDAAIKLIDIRKKVMNEPENWTSLKMAEYCHYNPTYFGKLYKKLFNANPTKDRNFFLVEKIKFYLKFTTLNLETIAERCNIQSIPYLINLFKSYENQTPTAWRKANAN